MILGEDEPLFVSPDPSPRSRKRHLDEDFNQSSQFIEIREDAPGPDDNEEYVDPSPKRPRRNRQKSKDAVRSALESLTDRRKLKRKSGTSRSSDTPNSSTISGQSRRPRRLPVAELITVSERAESSDPDDEEGKS